MPCLACLQRRSVAGRLCAPCRRELDRPTDVLTSGGVLVRSAFTHEGAGRRLVHRLKYAGHLGVLDVVADMVAALAPSGTTAFVPVPRAVVRRWRHGIDPSVELAGAVARRLGVAVIAALIPPVWYPHRAGPGGRTRGMPWFRIGRDVPVGAVLVDDVVTTGTTIDVAAATIGDVHHAVTVTAATSRTALRSRVVSR